VKEPKPIVIHPNPILRKVCDPLEPCSSEAVELASMLRETLALTTGIGLAAPQIGETARMFLLRCDPAMRDTNGLVMINPRITAASLSLTPLFEGCLSIPGERFTVHRPETVTVRFLTELGKEAEMMCSGLTAKCVQHELDHLDGILIVDRAVELGHFKPAA
jgi:peptide deformylase